MKKFILVVCLIVSIVSCKKSLENNNLNNNGKQLVLPENTYNYSDKIGTGEFINQKVTLGRVLFYDRFLSANNNISCGSCHKQQFGFADNVSFSKGIWGKDLTRNSLTIAGDGGNLFWDGRSASMQELVLKPISNHNEMFQDINKLVEKLAYNPNYPKLFKAAYQTEEISLAKISEALKLFCSSLKPTNARIIKEISNFSNIQLSSFSLTEKEGYNLFFGKAKCSSCHHITTSNYSGSFSNNGLDLDYKDNGLGEISKLASDNGVFKTPNLLNIEFTAPYMHDGRFKTLEEVIDFYDHQVQPHPNLSFVLKTNIPDEQLSNLIDSLANVGINIFNFEQLSQYIPDSGEPVKLNLTNNEKKALVDFLKTFSDRQFIVDPRFSDPFN